MHPFAALIGGSHVPAWHGPSRVHRLLDDPWQPPGRQRGSCKKAKPRRWVPWTLITPQREAEIAAGVWDMTNLWPFPGQEVQ